MKFYFLILPILVGGLLLTESAISADPPSAKNDKRWGITTKEPVVEEEDTKDGVEGKDADVSNNRKDNLHDQKKTPDRKADPGTEASKKNNVPGAENQKKEKESIEKKSTPGETEDINKKEAEQKSKEQKENEALIKWENEAQKTRCNGYLASLKESFLKARYYSIQGVPCGTAENARSFMTLIDQCKRDCPDGFLKKQGYTSRIIRNLSWLEKLGAERCPDMN